MQEKLYFTNSKGDRICGILNDPSESKRSPIVVMCHGFTTGKDSGTTTRLEKALEEVGIGSFRFDFYGHGESEGDFEDITVSEGVDDAHNAIEFLKGLGFKRIALYGGSYGGYVGYRMAADHPELLCVALKAPVADWKEKGVSDSIEESEEEWKQKGFTYYSSGKQGKLKLNYSFHEDSQGHSIYADAPKIKMPVLVVHGDADASVPISQSEKATSMIPNAELIVIEGSGHQISGDDFEYMLDNFMRFFVKLNTKI